MVLWLRQYPNGSVAGRLRAAEAAAGAAGAAGAGRAASFDCAFAFTVASARGCRAAAAESAAAQASHRRRVGRPVTGVRSMREAVLAARGAGWKWGRLFRLPY